MSIIEKQMDTAVFDWLARAVSCSSNSIGHQVGILSILGCAELVYFHYKGFLQDRLYFPRFFTSSSMRFFQSALRGLQARTEHTASLMTS